ncbi:cytotoxic granule associated RNA binding protein TIA1-like isoform X2 [Corticium candelabrum]|uniref:cytotoxic granule associated RNA binding protein TIA1-like isoform X2 n=1 Tax=Corticium candelabrum TaxID=121492 RepID=UPI002E276793|nr:cytotoxic granule associated RNA binding protein TIA1-like isoform X2 [Corticium candelabrum]
MSDTNSTSSDKDHSTSVCELAENIERNLSVSRLSPDIVKVDDSESSESRCSTSRSNGHKEGVSSDSVCETSRKRFNHHQVFIGDLSSDVDSDTLKAAFQPYGVVADARVVRDQLTGRSKSYGFVSFVDKMDATTAIKQMNGVFLCGRAIRVNWGARKGTERVPRQLSLEEIASQSTTFNSTVYVGGICSMTSEEQFRQKFGYFGIITDIRIFADKGYAFVKYRTHEEAACAIWKCHGSDMAGSNIKCSWGREDPAVYLQMQQYCQYLAQQTPPSPQQTLPYIPINAAAAAHPSASNASTYHMYYHMQYPYYNSQGAMTQTSYSLGSASSPVAAGAGVACGPVHRVPSIQSYNRQH